VSVERIANNSEHDSSSELYVDTGQIAARQRDVQRLLGRCMLRMQQYEKLLKAFLADAGFTASIDERGTLDLVRHHDTNLKSLGILVQAFLDGVLTTDEDSTGSNQLDAADQTRISFRTQFRLGMGSDDAASVTSKLKALVKVRNEIVHHFIDRFDVWSLEGCEAARLWLTETYETLDARYQELREWCGLVLDAFNHLRQLDMPNVLSKLADGIYPDGTVEWKSSGIVRALEEAAEQFGSEGWTPLEKATEWIASKYPEQTPERYSCNSWHQVVHLSKLLKIEYKRCAAGMRITGYRHV
jgi:hypothetical protein